MTVPLPPARPAWSHTWALGTIAVVVAVFEALTGLGLLFFYRPLVASAHLDLVDLAETSPFAFVRALHLWGGHALLIAASLHLFRVVVAGSYRPPRGYNYYVGMILGLAVVALALTGYLLPWDRHAQWLLPLLAPADGAAGDAFLTAVYALHCGALPVAGALLAVHHLRRARRDDAPEPERP